MPKSIQQTIGLVLLAASLFLAPSPSHAQAGSAAEPAAEPAATHNSGWSFVDVARVGQNGFTQLDAGRAGPDGEVVVSGVRNGRTGLFRVEEGVVTEVATDGTLLPGGLGTLGDLGAFSFQYAILPNGDVIFKARATEGSLSPAFLYTFRWSSGSITVAQPSTETDPNTSTQAFDHDLAQVTTDDRWLATLQTGPFPTTTTDYGLTDGATRQPIFDFTRGAANCIFDSVTLAAVNANGVVAYYQLLQTTPQVGGFCQGTTTRTWSVKLAGAATGTIASGASTENGNTYTGAELSNTSHFLMNNQNQVAAVRELHNSPTTFQIRRQLVVLKSGSEEIIQDTEGPASGIFLADFDQQGRVLYSVALDDFVTTVLLGGPDLEDDRVLRTGDPLFGQAVTALSWVARPAAPGDGEARAFAFQYGLDDGAAGIALARQERPRWTNPDGGNWGTPANWTPANVPSAGVDVRFDLAGAYAVNLGRQQVGSVQVRNGDVTFSNGELNVTATDSGINISRDTANAPARLTIRDTGAAASTVVTAATVSVGFGGPGELRIENARLVPPEGAESATATLGFAAPATATVTAGSAWSWHEMYVGMTHDSLLRVDDGAFVGFGADRLMVGGSVLALPVRNQTATAIVDNTSNNAGPLNAGTLLGIVTDLVIGESLIGKLEIKNGARTVAVTTTVGTRDHGTRTDGFLTVEGTNATLPARFESGGEESGGLFVATGAGTDALVTVSGGGVMSLARLSLADGAQSSALMFVDGLEATDGGDRRSTVTAPLPPLEPAASGAAAQSPGNGDCIIGRAGRGTLNVSNGGLVRCRQIAVGFSAGSRGELNIDGILRSVNARVVADGLRAEDGVICIGGVPLCGAASNNVRGEVVIGVDGILEGRIIGVGRGGRIRGSGLAITRDGVVVIDGGSVDPGIGQLSQVQTAAAAPAESAALEQVGTLTIQGNLIISETGVITLHVLGGTADLQDRLVVTGTVALHGELALGFANGYAPKTGDQLTLIQASSITGSPQEVTITGLAAGFDYDLSVVGGALKLTALNDGVATTQPPAQRIYLPLIQRTP